MTEKIQEVDRFRTNNGVEPEDESVEIKILRREFEQSKQQSNTATAQLESNSQELDHIKKQFSESQIVLFSNCWKKMSL